MLLMNDTRASELLAIREWMSGVLAAKPELNPTSWAKKADVAVTTITRHVYPKEGENPSVPSTRTLAKLAEAAKVAMPSLGPDEPPHNDLRPTDFDLPTSEAQDGTISIPEYDIKLSAGGGTLVEGDDIKARWGFSREYVTRELRASPNALNMVEVIGDSMEPKLMPGDRIIVDQNDTNPTPPGVFALWDGFGLVVKNVSRIHGADPYKLLLVSENSVYPPYEVLADEIKIIGRVVSCLRKM